MARYRRTDRLPVGQDESSCAEAGEGGPLWARKESEGGLAARSGQTMEERRVGLEVRAAPGVMPGNLTRYYQDR